MFRCKNCEQTFEEPLLKETTYEFWYGAPLESRTYLLLELCPFCKSDEFEEEEEEEGN